MFPKKKTKGHDAPMFCPFISIQTLKYLQHFSSMCLDLVHIRQPRQSQFTQGTPRNPRSLLPYHTFPPPRPSAKGTGCKLLLVAYRSAQCFFFFLIRHTCKKTKGRHRPAMDSGQGLEILVQFETTEQRLPVFKRDDQRNLPASD